MKPPRPHRAILVSVLLLSSALTTACGMGRDGAAEDQAALQKALSSVAAPKGLKPLGGAALECSLNIDCADIGSSVTYSQDTGHLKACKAAVELLGNVPAAHWTWTGSGGAAVQPSAPVMIAACVKALSVDPKPAGSPGQIWSARSDPKPSAVPVKSAKAQLKVEDPFDDTTAVAITLSYTGPSW